MLSRTTTTRPQKLDLRVASTLETQDTPLEARDYAILSVLGLNEREPVPQRIRMQKLMYIAQVGGLHDHHREPSDETYDPLPVYFPFSEGPHGPFSQELNNRLDELCDEGIISSTKHPSQSKRGRGHTEYEISPTGYQTLVSICESLPSEETRTLKYVKSIYMTVPLMELVRIVRSDFKFREVNDRWE